jgi:hypothetical protein
MDTLPWYRQPWPWFLLALPAAAVIGGIATTVLAVRSNDGVVAADYYKRGLAINEELSRRERAVALGVAVELEAQGLHPGDTVRMRVRGDQPLPAEATLLVRLVHPGRAGADRTALLARSGVSADNRSASYSGAWADSAADGGSVPARVAWSLVVESAAWRVDGGAEAAEGGALRAAVRAAR